MPRATRFDLSAKLAFLVLGLSLAACTSASEEALKDYEFIEKNGTGREKCEAAAKVAEAFRTERNAAQFEQWGVSRDIACMAARLDEKAGIVN